MPLHNFTFGLVLHKVYYETPSMLKGIDCFLMLETVVFIPVPEESYMHPLSLQLYKYYRTLFFSKTTEFHPFRLSSLVALFPDHATVLILLTQNYS